MIKNARHAAQIHWHFYRETRSKTKEWNNNSHKDEMSASLLFIFTSSLSISSDEENRELWNEHFYRFFFRIHVLFISSRMFHQYFMLFLSLYVRWLINYFIYWIFIVMGCFDRSLRGYFLGVLLIFFYILDAYQGR